MTCFSYGSAFLSIHLEILTRWSALVIKAVLTNQQPILKICLSFNSWLL